MTVSEFNRSDDEEEPKLAPLIDIPGFSLENPEIKLRPELEQLVNAPGFSFENHEDEEGTDQAEADEEGSDQAEADENWIDQAKAYEIIYDFQQLVKILSPEEMVAFVDEFDESLIEPLCDLMNLVRDPERRETMETLRKRMREILGEGRHYDSSESDYSYESESDSYESESGSDCENVRSNKNNTNQIVNVNLKCPSPHDTYSQQDPTMVVKKKNNNKRRVSVEEFEEVPDYFPDSDMVVTPIVKESSVELPPDIPSYTSDMTEQLSSSPPPPPPPPPPPQPHAPPPPPPPGSGDTKPDLDNEPENRVTEEELLEKKMIEERAAAEAVDKKYLNQIILPAESSVIDNKALNTLLLTQKQVLKDLANKGKLVQEINELNSDYEQSKKEFEAIDTPEMRVKFKMIRNDDEKRAFTKSYPAYVTLKNKMESNGRKLEDAGDEVGEIQKRTFTTITESRAMKNKMEADFPTLEGKRNKLLETYENIKSGKLPAPSNVVLERLETAVGNFKNLSVVTGSVIKTMNDFLSNPLIEAFEGKNVTGSSYYYIY